MAAAKNARCRQRFVVPTIYFNGKYVCRSSTIASSKEFFTRYTMDYVKGAAGGSSQPDDIPEDMDLDEEPDPSFWAQFNAARQNDIKLLEQLKVKLIIDLMVENKKVKYGMYMSSSEKVDKENRYSDFKIASLPYPGCEFFQAFKENNFCAVDLVFDWKAECDAPLTLPSSPNFVDLNIEWAEYKTWNLILITQNYLKYALKYLEERKSGVLVHCISGWDRTPLFISLLRVSLWADGLVHRGLDVNQMLYLTIAYDWFLFGHDLPNRVSKDEEVFFFCFYVLKFLMSDEYSLAPKTNGMQAETTETTQKTEINGKQANLTNGCSGQKTPEVCDNLQAPSTSVQRTPPIPVPCDKSKPAKCPISVGSSPLFMDWLMVSHTGSVDESKKCIVAAKVPPNPDAPAETGTVEVEEDKRTQRERKLTAIRSLLYRYYYRTVRRDVKMVPEPSFMRQTVGCVIPSFVTKKVQSQDED